MSHGSGINYERAEKRAKVKYDAEHADGAVEKKGFVRDGGKYVVGQETELKFGETPADVYRSFMRMQGIRFQKKTISEEN